MARGPLKPGTKEARAHEKLMAEMAAFLEVPVEEIEKKVPEKLEQDGDKIREAQSVLNYFRARGRGFKHKACEICKEKFAYDWDSDGISCCSFRCMAKKLESIGLKWNPHTPPDRRWGRTIPAVVPPSALKIVQQVLADTPEDQLDNTPPE